MTTPNGHAMDALYWWFKRGATGHGFNPGAPTVRHAREYSVGELQALVASQGFDVEDIYTRNYSHIDKAGFPGLLGPLNEQSMGGFCELPSAKLAC